MWDATHEQAVLFGGSMGDETWLFEPETASWTLAEPPLSPLGRQGASCVHDSDRERVVLFGGTPHDDSLWEWDGATQTWTEVPRAGDWPPAAEGYGMAYDSDRARVVTVGGRLDGGVKLGEHWEYDPAAQTWTQVTGTLPPPRDFPGLIYDTAAKRLVLWGGWSTNNDTWLYDAVGGGWTSLPSPETLYDHWGPGFVWAESAGRAVLFSGNLKYATWEWESATEAWSQTTNTSPPTQRGSMAWDPARERVVMLTGRKLYEWLGHTWSQSGGELTTAAGLVWKQTELASDPVDGTVLAFGGKYTSGQVMNGTWRWDGEIQTWTEMVPATTSPPAMAEHALVYHPVRGTVMLLTSVQVPGSLQLWEWSNATLDWALVPVSGSKPSARRAHSAAYDPVRGRLVTFSGATSNGMTDDVWEWDHTTLKWTQVTPDGSGPAPRLGYAMAWDPVRKRVVVHGGNNPVKSDSYHDTWEWDGATWTEVARSSHPGTDQGQNSTVWMAWDEVLDRGVLYWADEVWELYERECAAAVDCPVAAPCVEGVACVAGACAYAGDSEGQPCADGSVCTADEACAAGTCEGVALPCDDGDDCTGSGCDPLYGCTFPTVVAECDDGDPCTTGELCVEGACQAGSIAACDDGDPCTVDSCAGDGACSHAPAPAGTGCDDGLACTTGDQCLAGECAGAADPACTPCASAAACDDGDPCTADECFQGFCVREAVAFTWHLGEVGEQQGGTLVRMADGGYAVGGRSATGPYGGDDALVVRLNAAREVAWDWHFGGVGSEAVSGLARVGEDELIAATTGSAGGWIHRLDKGGGRRWSAPVDVPLGTVTLATDDVLVTAQRAQYGQAAIPVSGISAVDGSVLWSFDVEGAEGGYVTNPGVQSRTAAGTVLVTIFKHGVLEVDASGGQTLHVAPVQAYGAVETADGGYFVAGYEGLVRTDEAMSAIWTQGVPGTDGSHAHLSESADGGVFEVWDASSHNVLVKSGRVRRRLADGRLLWDLAKGKSKAGFKGRIGLPQPNHGLIVGGSHFNFGAAKEDMAIYRYDTWGNLSCVEECSALVTGDCDDDNPCTVDRCAVGGCTHSPVTGACDDGDECTTGDTCSEGTCGGAAVVCNDGDPCTLDGCNTSSGECTVAIVADGEACEDGLECTEGTTCLLGTCGGGEALCPACETSGDCPDGEACTQAGCFSNYCQAGPTTGQWDVGQWHQIFGAVASLLQRPDGSLMAPAAWGIQRLGLDGTVLWEETGPVHGYQQLAALEQGGWAVAGLTTNDSDVQVRRFTANDELMWETAVGQNTPRLSGMAALGGTDLVVVGSPAASFTGIWVARLGPDGAVQWNVQHLPAGKSSANATAVVTEPTGTIVVAGWTKEPALGGWVGRFAGDGKLLLSSPIKPAGETLYFRGLLRDADGALIFTGTRNAGAGDQVWVGALEPDLTLDWAHSYGGSWSERGNAIAQAPDGGYLVAGDRNRGGADGWGLYLLRLSASGGLLWEREKYSGWKEDASGSVAALEQGGFAVGARFGYDAMVFKLDAFGNLLCTEQCDGLGPGDCADEDACTMDSCDVETGCANLPIACDDGDPCTTDYCSEGACVTATASCNDGNPCTDDSCTPGQGCKWTPNSAPCNDGDYCTHDDTCIGGGCLGVGTVCSDGNPCTADLCVGDSGCHFPPTSGECTDGDPCTTGDACEAGACAGDPVVCGDGLACTDDACAGGGCTYTSTCDDSNACTDDACTQAGCVFVPLACEDGNLCTDDSCAGGECIHPPLTGACDDDDACTTGEQCLGGACTGGAPVVCDDSDACVAVECQALAGCVSTPLDCEDGFECTFHECVAGVGCALLEVDHILCEDGLVCTADACVEGAGCKSAPIDCDDQDACTADTCSEPGGCKSTSIAAECVDNDPCTADSCDPAVGCVAPPKSGPCEDGDACTVGDECVAGTCAAGGVALNCDDGDSCTTDECFGETGCENAPVDCEDGHDCTNHSCVGELGCVLDDLDHELCHDGLACTAEECTLDAGCIYPALDCDDEDACTADSCVEPDGCVHTSVAATCADDEPCTDDGCDPALGCVAPPNSAPCDDGDKCTLGDQCEGGACKPGPEPLDCDDGEPCTVDSCHGKTACAHFELDGPPCDDGDACTVGETCLAGECDPVGAPDCDDGLACTADSCAPATGCVHLPDHVVCDDGNDCTINACALDTGCTTGPDDGAACDTGHPCFATEVCSAGACVGDEPVDCSDGEPCTADTCAVESGCESAPLAEGAACDDGSLCTTGDTCQGGTCIPGASLTCADDEPCTFDSCDSLTGCTHAAMSGVACDDGDACTKTDVCEAGACVGLGAVSCDDGQACTADSCEPAAGCVWTPDEGATCDDGDGCTTSDVCAADGSCGGAPVTCEDDNDCTADACEGGQCLHAPQDGECDDGDSCTDADQCKEGACVGSQVADCDDADPCTADGCDPGGGCTHAPLSDVECDDDSECTLPGQCSDGECLPVAGDGCDDGDPCTQDSCDGSGQVCEHAPASGVGCTDEDPCTTEDTCVAGGCVGAPLDCDDENPCTLDTCGDGGCTNTALDAVCDDGDACTQGDSCASGVCEGAKVTCADGNPCTADACDPAQGCVFTPAPAPCDDGDPCTAVDVCSGGTCTSGVNAACDDDDACTNDLCAPGGGCSHTFNTAACDDGDPCTVGDLCAAGGCVGGGPKCDDSNQCTADECVNGSCSHPPGPTAPCDDSDACTTGEYCIQGQCAGQVLLACDDGNECTDDSCDPALGCTWTPTVGACDDGEPCTAGDSCLDGVCAAGPPTACDDSNECTSSGCTPGVGCEYAPVSGGCEDGDACTAADFCAYGQCVSGPGQVCEDLNPCTDDACDPAIGCLHTPNAAGCDDGEPCTQGDLCAAGVCVAGAPTVCDDGNECTEDSCVAGSGCFFGDVAGPCDDADPCTVDDLCLGGVCVPGPGASCDDDNPCTDDACHPDVGCLYAANTHGCDDSDPCTTGDACADGVCTAGQPAECDDGNPCTADTCAAGTGCVNPPIAGTPPCDDGDPCTTGEACAGGACVGGIGLDCDDGNPCTDNLCDPAVGCATVANQAACDDGDLCTGDDHCLDGVCAAGAPVDCNDANPCTTGECTPSGCVQEAVGGPCNDDDSCTTGDACEDGQCVGVGPDCDDGDPCTLDGCDLSQACVYLAASSTTPCDDGLACNGEDHCADGVCVAGLAEACDDGDVCTDDSCTDDGQCHHAAREGCCLSDADCPESGACVTLICETPGEVCVGLSEPGCCKEPADCDDGNVCTADECGADGSCTHGGVPGCCRSDADCGAGQHCDANVCLHADGTPVLGTPIPTEPPPSVDPVDGGSCASAPGPAPASGLAWLLALLLLGVVGRWAYLSRG